MARGATLLSLLDKYRAEAGSSLNPAHNQQVRDTQIQHLQRVQEWLWDDFDWPHLRVERSIPTAIAQRYYGLPTDLTLERLKKVELFLGGHWCALRSEITAWDYSLTNSDLGERSYPPRAWRIGENENVELWPVPDTAPVLSTQDGYIRFTGIRKLRPLVNDADVADLDDRLITLYAAAEALQSKGDKAAQLKINQALTRYNRLKADLSKARPFQMFGVGLRERSDKMFVGTYRPPV